MLTRILILCEIMWYSNTLQFPFQEIYKEYAQISAQKLCLRRFSMQHQNMVWQDIRRWSKQRSEALSQKVQHATSEHGLARHQKMVKAESEHGSMEASEELEVRSRSTEVLMV